MDYKRTIAELEAKRDRQQAALAATKEHLEAIQKLQQQETANAQEANKPPKLRT